MTLFTGLSCLPQYCGNVDVSSTAQWGVYVWYLQFTVGNNDCKSMVCFMGLIVRLPQIHYQKLFKVVSLWFLLMDKKVRLIWLSKCKPQLVWLQYRFPAVFEKNKTKNLNKNTVYGTHITFTLSSCLLSCSRKWKCSLDDLLFILFMSQKMQLYSENETAFGLWYIFASILLIVGGLWMAFFFGCHAFPFSNTWKQHKCIY